ncbi:hypothetical protein TNCT_353051 [Trichonephila clavata]|uniref:Uncharacterized protein n=1 Tax=Trichonephila clavata TaxID=2740835 RepID=A0A8X6JMV5_TRICU|nr:hypothetical protein TNCT_353051 [Trichonephila clavata]
MTSPDPSHVGIIGIEIADSLAKAASLDTSKPDMHSIFSEFSDCKKKQRNLCRTPPNHVWYPPSTLLVLYTLKVIQTSRLAYLDLPVDT